MGVEFKDKVRSAMRERKLTHNQAAEALGCSRATLSYWLVGGKPSYELHQRAMQAFPELREREIAS